MKRDQQLENNEKARQTAKEVYDLALASHKYYTTVETSKETWTTPEDIESKAGVVSYDWNSGTTVSENIKELWKTLAENGIDVWVCSASATDPIRAAVDAWGLHDYVTGVLAMTRRDLRYGALSQVLLRDRWSGRVETLENREFRALGGQARRVVTMPARENYKAVRYSGQFQLERSASELERLEVTLGEVFSVWPGDLVTVQRSGWGWNGRYRAVQVINGMDQDGLWSRVELAEPDVLI